MCICVCVCVYCVDFNNLEGSGLSLEDMMEWAYDNPDRPDLTTYGKVPKSEILGAKRLYGVLAGKGRHCAHLGGTHVDDFVFASDPDYEHVGKEVWAKLHLSTKELEFRFCGKEFVQDLITFDISSGSTAALRR